MSQPFEGFCGLSYQLENKYAAVERTVNYYCEVNESLEEKKFKVDLLPSPGNAPFSTLPVPPPFNQPARGILEYRGQVFGVNGDVIFYMDAAGNMTNLLGGIQNDGKPVSMVGNGNDQIFIASATFGYVIKVAYPGSLSTVQGIGFGDFFGASYATFQDGYIIVTTPGSNQFQISGTDDVPIGDATQWSGANISIQAGQADKLVAALSSREYLRLFGARRSQIYQNVGNAGIGGFPFQSYNETFIETGCGAPYSIVDLGESLFWIGEDARGQRAAWRDAAFQPQRVSNFAVEQFWQSYPTIADAVAFPFIWQGHLMIQITFPTANKTWVYDVTVSGLMQRQCWTERSFLDVNGNEQARPERFHCFAYGKHLVSSAGADGNAGAVYQYSGGANVAPRDAALQGDGTEGFNAMVRDRICPHFWQGNKRIVYNRIEFEVSRGQGADGGGFPANPVLLLRWSNDGGYTWSNEFQIQTGKLGDFSKRALMNRLGYARDRVFWVRCSDPAFVGLVAAELDLFVCAS